MCLVLSLVSLAHMHIPSFCFLGHLDGGLASRPNEFFLCGLVWFHEPLCLVRLVSVHIQSFSFRGHLEDTFPGGWSAGWLAGRPAKPENNANLSPAWFSWGLG